MTIGTHPEHIPCRQCESIDAAQQQRETDELESKLMDQRITEESLFPEEEFTSSTKTVANRARNIIAAIKNLRTQLSHDHPFDNELRIMEETYQAEQEFYDKVR